MPVIEISVCFRERFDSPCCSPRASNHRREAKLGISIDCRFVDSNYPLPEHRRNKDSATPTLVSKPLWRHMWTFGLPGGCHTCRRFSSDRLDPPRGDQVLRRRTTELLGLRSAKARYSRTWNVEGRCTYH